jgi:hypothetical protein
LKTLYETRFKASQDTDNRIIKAKLLLIAVLVKAELTQLCVSFDQMIAAHTHQKVVANLYAKAIRKHEHKATSIFDAYDRILAELKRQVMPPGMKPEERILKPTDLALIGVGDGQNALEQLCRECRAKFGMLKSGAATPVVTTA